jgi:hypothetical protein
MDVLKVLYLNVQGLKSNRCFGSITSSIKHNVTLSFKFLPILKLDNIFFC